MQFLTKPYWLLFVVLASFSKEVNDYLPKLPTLLTGTSVISTKQRGANIFPIRIYTVTSSSINVNM
jgi:hypothetical protein